MSVHPDWFISMTLGPPRSTLFPYTTLFRSKSDRWTRSRTLPPSSGLAKLGHPVPESNLSSELKSGSPDRSEEHTSELQSHHDLVCRLLLEKKKSGVLAVEPLPTASRSDLEG